MSYSDAGYIIISNDYKLSGIFLDAYFFIIPVPGEKVSVLQTYWIDSFFPSGYIIKQLPSFETGGSISMTLREAYLNNSAFCRSSYTVLYYNKNIPIDDLNNPWAFELQCKDSNIKLVLYGYIDKVDAQTKKGSVKLVFSRSAFNSFVDFQAIPSNYFASIAFSNDGNFINLEGNASINVYGEKQNIVFRADNKVASMIQD